MNEKATGYAKGGITRSQNLTHERRVEIAKSGALARWSDEVEIAKCSGKIEIGDTIIPCAVLNDGTRVLSERAIVKAFGGKRGGSHWKRLKEMEGGAYLPVFLSAKNMYPFINKELMDGSSRRRYFKMKRGGVSFSDESS